MNKKGRYICFIARGTPNIGLEVLVRKERLLMEYFAERFENLIFLDVSKVFTSRLDSNGEITTSAHALLHARYNMMCPSTIVDLKKIFRSFNMIVISNFSEQWKDWYLHYYLKKFSIPLIYVNTLSETRDFVYAKAATRNIFTRFYDALKIKFFRLLNLFRAYLICARVDTYFVSNRKLAQSCKKSSRYKEIVLINNRFYDGLLANQLDICNDYVVFIDSHLADDKDQMNYGHQPIDRKLYYSSLNTVLDQISHLVGKELIICLNPKYNLKNKEQDYGLRKAIRFKTEEMVAKADLVLCHESSAINFAILYNKRTLQLTGRYFNEFVRRNIEACQKVYGFQTLDIFEADINSIREAVQNVRINRNKYDSHIFNTAIASGQEGVYSHVQIANHLSQKYGVT